MTRASTPNRLLRALAAGDYALLAPGLRSVSLAAGDALSGSHERPRAVYFPETAVLSLVVDMTDGSAVEAATVGNEGVAGLSAFLGRGTMSTRCLVQIAGEAQRIGVSAMRRAADASAPLTMLLHRYTQAFINQLAQSVACNRRHSLDQRCARWLLMTHDRVGGDQAFDLTQEFLSYMLGVRRESVSGALHAFQDAEIIRYRRGHMTILDRKALELAACECYRATRDDFALLFG